MKRFLLELGSSALLLLSAGCASLESFELYTPRQKGDLFTFRVGETNVAYYVEEHLFGRRELSIYFPSKTLVERLTDGGSAVDVIPDGKVDRRTLRQDDGSYVTYSRMPLSGSTNWFSDPILQRTRSLCEQSLAEGTVLFQHYVSNVLAPKIDAREYTHSTATRKSH